MTFDQPLTTEERATNHDTWTHIHQVQTYLIEVADDILQRCLTHDQSKLRAPEVSTFTEYSPRLKTAEYGSPEYKQFLVDMKPALENHYAMNSHHPEHHSDGVDGMTLMDVLEMLVDWLASTKRTKNGNIYKSIELQKERFDIDPQLLNIMKNTIRKLHPEIEEK